MELWQLEATALARLIRLGRVSAREATEAVLARLDQANPRVNAVVRRDDAEARAMADAADAARARGDLLGPLHGVPVTTKVNVDQAGHPTDDGMPDQKDAFAREDHPAVANLRRAGAVFVGRTNTPAFSMRFVTDNPLHGRTLNPLDPAIIPGGSSGGAAAAVATGCGPIAQGNDIGGSIRVPAQCCGVVGLRPSHGRVPAFNPSHPGRLPVGAWLMTVNGPLTRSVADARLALAVMAGGDPRDALWVDAPLRGPPPPRPIRVALVPELPGGTTHPAQAAAVRQAGRHLEAAGYAVEERLPPDLGAAADAGGRLIFGDVMPVAWPMVQARGDAATRTAMRLAMDLFPHWDAAAALAALADREALLRQWQTFFVDTPLVVLPVLAELPPEQDIDLTPEGQARMQASARCCMVSPLLGIPALAVPVGRAGRLRTGVQILAARFREDLCLDAGEVIEAAEGPVLPVDPAG